MKIRISYRDIHEQYHTELPLEQLPVIEQLRWIRQEWSHSKQNHTPLMFYFSSLKRLVYCESYLEAQTLLDLDFRGETNCIVEQPFILHYNKKFHIPDYVLRQGFTTILINVKPKKFLETPENITDFALASEAARQLGWMYQTVSECNPQYLENINWLGSFKHRPFQVETYEVEILKYLNQSSTLLELLKHFKNDFIVKPIVFYLLWHRRIQTSLDQRFSLQMPLWKSTEYS